MPLREYKSGPLYNRVKAWVLQRIDSGVWGESQRIASEHELIEKLGVSRMTVNRALRELAEEGHLVRVVGVGSFVADRRIQMHPLEIRNIADEIAERGHAHASSVVLLPGTRSGGVARKASTRRPSSSLYAGKSGSSQAESTLSKRAVSNERRVVMGLSESDRCR